MFSHLRGSPCRILRNPQTVFSVYAVACVARANRNTPQPRFPLRIAMPPHAAYQSTQTNAIQRKQHRTATPPTPFPLLNHASPRKQRYKPTLPTPLSPNTPNPCPISHVTTPITTKCFLARACARIYNVCHANNVQLIHSRWRSKKRKAPERRSA